MTVKEFPNLKRGDLITCYKQLKHYYGLVFEVVDISGDGFNGCKVIVKQPNFDNGFRLTINNLSHFKKYEG